ncbi:MAG: hypothetical protein ACOYBO_00960 [Azonexus sp.]
MPPKRNVTYRKLDLSIRTGVSFTPEERLESHVLQARMTTRRARRWLLGVCSILIIGGLIDPIMNVARALTIWSVLVLGVGAVSVVFIRAYMVGLLGAPVLFAGVGVTVAIALGVGLTVTTAARRAAITVQRVQIPEWLSEEA